MRAHAAFLVSSVCGLCILCCGPGAEPARDGTVARAPTLILQDDGDFGGDPDVDTSLGGDPASSPAPAAASSGPESGGDDGSHDETSAETRDVCVAACKGGPAARAQFCELVIPAFYVGCRRRVSGSTAACVAWCFWTY